MTSHDTQPSPKLGSFSFRNAILVTAITCAGLALRVIRLDMQPLWWDEGYSVFFATRDFGTMLDRTARDIHPPLYYALLQYWMMPFGKSQVALRLFSVLIGVLAIPLLYVLARRLFPKPRIALISALILAIAPLHIYYSQEIRMYGLVTLLGLASIYLFVILLELQPGKTKTAVVASGYILV
jgi:predicted membrane-bound mannosyltransferase